MPLSDDQLRQLESTLETLATETLRSRGWDAHLVVVRSPVADDLAIRIQGTATIANQLVVTASELRQFTSPAMAGDYFALRLERMTREFPALMGSRSERRQDLGERLGVGVELARPAPMLPPTPRKKPPAPPEPEPRSRYELLMADDDLISS